MITNLIDLILIIDAILFNSLIICIFITLKKDNVKWRKIFGAAWISLIIPTSFVFVFYLTEGRELNIIISILLILVYFIVEILLDNIFKYDFRSKWKTHVPYIILEYIALFSFINIAFSIDQISGWIVSITFWGVMGSIIYLYAGKKSEKNTKS